jgi:hypothetical protein
MGVGAGAGAGAFAAGGVWAWAFKKPVRDREAKIPHSTLRLNFIFVSSCFELFGLSYEYLYDVPKQAQTS